MASRLTVGTCFAYTDTNAAQTTLGAIARLDAIARTAPSHLEDVDRRVVRPAADGGDAPDRSAVRPAGGTVYIVGEQGLVLKLDRQFPGVHQRLGEVLLRQRPMTIQHLVQASTSLREAMNLGQDDEDLRRDHPHDAYDALRFLEQFPTLPAEMSVMASHLTVRLTEEFILPVDVDLIVEAKKLIDGLENHA